MKRTFEGIEFSECFPKLTDSKIAEVEAELGLSFPLDYRKFLLQVNGGVPNSSDFQLANSEHEVCIDYFYGIGSERKFNDLIYEQGTIRDRMDNYPEDYLAIGFDPGSAPFVYSLAKDDLGSVYFFDPQGFYDASGVPRFHLVAHSFTEFIQKLRPPK